MQGDVPWGLRGKQLQCWGDPVAWVRGWASGNAGRAGGGGLGREEGPGRQVWAAGRPSRDVTPSREQPGPLARLPDSDLTPAGEA